MREQQRQKTIALMWTMTIVHGLWALLGFCARASRLARQRAPFVTYWQSAHSSSGRPMIRTTLLSTYIYIYILPPLLVSPHPFLTCVLDRYYSSSWTYIHPFLTCILDSPRTSSTCPFSHPPIHFPLVMLFPFSPSPLAPAHVLTLASAGLSSAPLGGRARERWRHEPMTTELDSAPRILSRRLVGLVHPKAMREPIERDIMDERQ